MSKLFCEICGTAYSENADQCPICGCPKPENVEYSDSSVDYADSVTRPSSSVKGGRFSKSNVNKRIKAKGVPVKKSSQQKKSKKKTNKAERGLIVAIILLLAAILAVVGYILFNYFVPQTPSGNTYQPTDDTRPSISTSTYPTILPTTEPMERPCTGLSISEGSIRFNTVGATWLMNVIHTPANTTDTMTYLSSDANVATVTADGRVTAVGSGECTITVVCGDIAAECQVVCDLAPQGTTPGETDPEETQPEETAPADADDFKLNREDFTIAVGESWLLYNGPIDPSEIVWTSSNTSVATVKDGKVRGVGRGQCWITAEYKGIKLKCIVYVTD